MKKKVLLAPFGAFAVFLAVASVAYACTIVRGQTEIKDLGGTAVTCNTDANPPPAECTLDVSQSLAIKAQSINGTADIAGKTFYMHFLNKLADQDSMKICMSGLRASHPDKRISGPVQADASTGNIPLTDGTLPSNMHPGGKTSDDHLPHNGVASVCFVTDGYGYGTQDATILITGGTS